MASHTVTNASAAPGRARAAPRSPIGASEHASAPSLARAKNLQRTVGNQAMSRLMRSAGSGSDPVDVPLGVRSVLNGSGYALNPATRAAMEARLGYDFSRVRVHVDAPAAAAARAMKARAFTVGSHVVFASGQYAPHTGSGKRLLAHELAHTVQQRDSVMTSAPLTVSAPHDAREVEAEHAARSVAPEVASPRSHCCGCPACLASAPAHIARDVDPLGGVVPVTPKQRLERMKDLFSRVLDGPGMLNGMVSDGTVIELRSADGTTSRLFRVYNPMIEVPNLGVHGESGLVRNGNAWEIDEIAAGSASDAKAGRIVLDERQTIGDMALSLYRTLRQTRWPEWDAAALKTNVGQADPAKARADYVKSMVDAVIWRNVEQLGIRRQLREAGAAIKTSLPFENEYDVAYTRAFIEEVGKGSTGGHAMTAGTTAAYNVVKDIIESGKVVTHTNQKYAEHFGQLFDERQAELQKQQAALASNAPGPQGTTSQPPVAAPPAVDKPVPQAQQPAPQVQDPYQAFMEMPQWQKDRILSGFKAVASGTSEEPAAEPPPPAETGCHADPFKRTTATSACAPGHHKQQDDATRVASKLLKDPEFTRDIARQEREQRARLDRLNEAHFHWQATKQYIHRHEFSPYEIERDNIVPASTRWDVYNKGSENNLEKADFNEYFFVSEAEYRTEWRRRRAEYAKAYAACNDKRGIKAPKASRKRPEYLDCREAVQAEYFPGGAALQDAARWAIKRDIDVGMPAVTDQGLTSAFVFNATHEWLGWSTDESAAAAGFAANVAGLVKAKFEKHAALRPSTPAPTLSVSPTSAPTARVAPKPDIQPMPKPDPWGSDVPAKQNPTTPAPVQPPPPPIVTPSVRDFKGPDPNAIQGGGQRTSPPSGQLAVVGEGNMLGPVYQPKNQRQPAPSQNEAAQQVAQQPLAATGTGQGGAVIVQSGGTAQSGQGQQPTSMTGRAPPPGVGANAPTSGGVATRTDTGSGAKQPNLVVVGGSGPQRAQNVAAKPGTGTTGIVPDVHLQTRLNELQTRQAQLVQELLKQRGTVASKNKTLTDLNDQNISTTDPKILQAKKRLADEQRKLSQVEGRLRDVKNDINRVNWELASGAKPWRQMPLDSEARIGLHAELEAGVRLIEKGWEPIGKTTLNPDLIRLPADYHKALREYQGRQGIDGVYRRVRNGRVEYLIVESKGTLDASARAPSGKGKLETTANGDQLSRNWTTNNLKRSGLDSADRADLEKAMGEGRARSVYAQTTKKGTSFFNVDAVSDTEVKIGDPFDP